MLMTMQTAFNAITAGLSLTKEGSKPFKHPELIATKGSMTELLGDFIIEPTIIVTEDAAYSSMFGASLELNVNMFCSLYTNSFSKMVTVHGVEPKVAFRALSSRGTSLAKVIDTMDVSIGESDLEDIMTINSMFFGESERDDIRKVKNTNRSGKEVKEPNILNRHIEVIISHDGKDVVIPIIVRATVIKVSTRDLIDYVSVNGHRSEFLNSWHRLRSKEDTLGEFLFATKLLDEFDEAIKNDKTDIIKLLEERKRDSIGNATSAGIGFGRYFGSIIMSNDEVAELNIAIRGKLTRERDKTKLLERVASFNLMTINEDGEMVTVYTSRIKGASYIPFKSLKEKNDSDVMSDIFKSLTQNKKIDL